MPNKLRGFYKVGGASLVASGILFLVNAVLDLLSLAMARGASGKVVAYLGIATAVADVVGSFPWLIGPVPTLVCQVFFAGWFVAVGSKLCRMSEHSMTIHAPTS